MSFDPVHFIRTETAVASPAIVPELRLYLAAEVTPLWQLTEERLKSCNLPPPFWAFAWPGGQGMARYLLDHPEEVRGKRVLDFAAGSGVAALAAMKAGAKSALAVDIDGLALESVRLNAELNGVEIQVAQSIDLEKPPRHIDLIIAGDVCYQQAMSAVIMRWLWRCVAAGIRVLMADPGRAYVPYEGLQVLMRVVVPTSRDLEDQESRDVTVWELVVPEQSI